jgi:PAS domain S-box-containing protein
VIVERDGVVLYASEGFARLAGTNVERVVRPCTYQGAPAQLIGLRARREQSFRELIEQIPDLIAVHRRGSIVYANPALLAYLGRPDVASMVGRSILELVHPDDRGRLAERLRKLAASGLPGAAETMRHLRADGTVTLLDCSSVPIDFEGAPATLVLGRDVTDQRQTQERGLEAELFASIGMLAAVVNHELSNPLGTLDLNAAQLERYLAPLVRPEPGLPPAQLTPTARTRLATSLDDLRHGLDRMMDVAKDFKALTGIGAGQVLLGPVDLPAVVGSASRLAAAELRGRCSLDLRLRPVAPVRGQSGRLGQVVLNLIVNAAQAPPPRVRRLVQVRTHEIPAGARLTVEDDGEGVHPELVERIFEPFFTTKTGGEGSGLGLAVCRSIVTGFGGTIDVHASELGGARFEVDLPRWE